MKKLYAALCFFFVLPMVHIAFAETTSNATAQDIHGRLESLSQLSYDQQDFFSWVKDGNPKLAEVYTQLVSQQDAVAMLQHASSSSLITAANQNLMKLQGEMTSFFAAYTLKPEIGSEQAVQDPYVIVILGCNPSILDERLNRALPFIRKFSSVPVILSGKGRGKFVETQYMQEYLLKAGVSQDRLILEKDSKDTVGNAVFSALEMQRRKINGGNVLVVTSSFHAPRSLFLFKSVLGSRFKVAVAAAPHDANTIPAIVYVHELKDEALATNLFQWGEIDGKNMHTKTPCDDLYQIVLYHKLYKEEWNAIRQYADVCEIE